MTQFPQSLSRLSRTGLVAALQASSALIGVATAAPVNVPTAIQA